MVEFDLATSDGPRAALAVAALSLVAAVVCALVFGAAFLIFIAGTGPALFYLFAGAPQKLEVYEKHIVIRYALRSDQTVEGSDLRVQRMPDELVIIAGTDTLVLDGRVFGGQLLEKCGDALSSVASDTLDRRSARRPTL